MDDLITDFTAECREMLEALGGELVAWWYITVGTGYRGFGNTQGSRKY